MRYLLFVMMSMLLMACNLERRDVSTANGDASSVAVPMISIKIYPWIGRIVNASVVLYNANSLEDRRGSLGDRLVLNRDGYAEFNVPEDVSFLLGELVTNAETAYLDDGFLDDPLTADFDESQVSFPLDSRLRVGFRLADVDSQGRVAMTILTEVAVSRAVAQTGDGEVAPGFRTVC